uniref:Uncharacterized protein n=1 Tax=Chromera velia CCMP2878 TaxID=1169474 RepID=A0A0G4F5L7_9ALVE|eukprot:Cvel_15281.t1-p1 / transcript=Cvel_15281.t1 / gene=Cvel_15281 / organism=Chromera_velia_CCMP2878 / gene_product=hypothetical protein / transcript_product=hypothetical protein / location=Cvel_scaffold1121:28787-29531(-) / protein_length=143 / sequence_SO=supercontig / SO=protein_coding / is_pseudo=false
MPAKSVVSSGKSSCRSGSSRASRPRSPPSVAGGSAASRPAMGLFVGGLRGAAFQPPPETPFQPKPPVPKAKVARKPRTGRAKKAVEPQREVLPVKKHSSFNLGVDLERALVEEEGKEQEGEGVGVRWAGAVPLMAVLPSFLWI